MTTLSMSDLAVSDFDPAEFLTDEETIAAYLTETFATGTQEEFIQALSTVARARGMTQLAKDTGLPRESLYKTLSGASKPRFDTIAKISSALGLNIAFIPRTA
ncbi:addiction module antidote protein [Actinobacillus porcinus]|uniref:addiction module antidote protein n=1 Tax=Actinobacillus porcinus TaxID=51048 RepID=UPI0023F157C5|nr:addiction module antidote protein [Actinobacillus porcinus]MDD7544842.1 putative addiction module antidote protein [Actinobacillus porcinus]MDY5847237.1 addiction module antidote protein [Actinobacillus porcinus]